MIGPTCFVLIAYYLTSQPLEVCRLIMFWGICFLTGWLSQVTGLLSGSAFSIEVINFILFFSIIADHYLTKWITESHMLNKSFHRLKIKMKNCLACNLTCHFNIIFYFFQLGVLIVPATAIPMLMFSGFFIRFRELFTIFQPITYISYFRYGFEGAIHAVYGFDREKLPCSEGVCYFSTIEKFLKYIDMEVNNYFLDVVGLLVWIFVLNMLLYIALKIRLKRAQ